MRQRARRLVERDHPRVAQQRLADLDHLPLRDRQPPQLRLRIEIDAHRGEPLAHEALRVALADPAERARQPAEQQVLGHRQIGHVLQLLMDHRDARRDRRGRARKAHRPPVDEHAARIGLIFAAENLEQRRLARPVLAHQPVHLSRLHVERNAVERTHAGKDLADIVKTQCRSHVASVSCHARCLIACRIAARRASRDARRTSLTSPRAPSSRAPARRSRASRACPSSA